MDAGRALPARPDATYRPAAANPLSVIRSQMLASRGSHSTRP